MAMGLGPLPAFVGLWAVMTVAMMVPSALPPIALVADVRGVRGAAVVTAAYVAVWVAFGIAAYDVYAPLGSPTASHWATAATLLAAGAYQLTPLKRTCLRFCRLPVHALLHEPFRAGLSLGARCVGCCAGLMAALFALGVMSLPWMAAATAVVAAEKLLPGGERLVRPLGVALLAAGAGALA